MHGNHQNKEAIVGKVARKYKPANIKTLDKVIQANTGYSGAYNMCTGEIEIGATEEDICILLWHENMHKFFFENYSLETCVMWDGIADSVQEFLFGETGLPYVYTVPTARPSICKRWATLHKKL